MTFFSPARSNAGLRDILTQIPIVRLTKTSGIILQTSRGLLLVMAEGRCAVARGGPMPMEIDGSAAFV